jgi:hypothetical protein
MPRYQYRDDDRSSRTGLYVLVGALAGVAVGFLVSEQAGGLDGVRRRARSLFGRASRLLTSAASAEPNGSARDLAEEFGRGDDPDAEGDDLESSEWDELEDRILEAFRNDPVLANRAVDISVVDDGVVELTGWVRLDKEKPHAVTIARGVPGVHKVESRLAVRRPSRAP